MDGTPIAGLKVVLDKEKIVETNKDGSFVFDGVKTGLHNIQVKGGKVAKAMPIIFGLAQKELSSNGNFVRQFKYKPC